MIFDSPRMELLRNRFANKDDFHVPYPITVDRLPTLSGEKRVLEELISTTEIPDSKRTDLVNSFISDDPRQYWGAWFEIKLLGWLRALGSVSVSPEISSLYGGALTPDFLLRTKEHSIVVEAFAYQERPIEQRYSSMVNDLFTAFTNIRLPFRISAHYYAVGSAFNRRRIVSEVSQWLNNEPDRPYVFRDEAGTDLLFEAQRDQTLDSVRVGNVSSPIALEQHESLRSRLAEKIGYGNKLLMPDCAYVIAILLLPHSIDTLQVHPLLFGMSVSSDEQPNVRFEGPGGLLFAGGAAHGKVVSGILAFNSFWRHESEANELQATYFPHPFGNVALPQSIFPAQHSLIQLPTEQDLKLPTS